MVSHDDHRAMKSRRLLTRLTLDDLLDPYQAPPGSPDDLSEVRVELLKADAELAHAEHGHRAAESEVSAAATAAALEGDDGRLEQAREAREQAAERVSEAQRRAAPFGRLRMELDRRSGEFDALRQHLDRLRWPEDRATTRDRYLDRSHEVREQIERVADRQAAAA